MDDFDDDFLEGDYQMNSTISNEMSKPNSWLTAFKTSTLNCLKYMTFTFDDDDHFKERIDSYLITLLKSGLLLDEDFNSIAPYDPNRVSVFYRTKMFKSVIFFASEQVLTQFLALKCDRLRNILRVWSGLKLTWNLREVILERMDERNFSRFVETLQIVHGYARKGHGLIKKRLIHANIRKINSPSADDILSTFETNFHAGLLNSVKYLLSDIRAITKEFSVDFIHENITSVDLHCLELAKDNDKMWFTFVIICSEYLRVIAFRLMSNSPNFLTYLNGKIPLKIDKLQRIGMELKKIVDNFQRFDYDRERVLKMATKLSANSYYSSSLRNLCQNSEMVCSKIHDALSAHCDIMARFDSNSINLKSLDDDYENVQTQLKDALDLIKQSQNMIKSELNQNQTPKLAKITSADQEVPTLDSQKIIDSCENVPEREFQLFLFDMKRLNDEEELNGDICDASDDLCMKSVAGNRFLMSELKQALQPIRVGMLEKEAIALKKYPNFDELDADMELSWKINVNTNNLKDNESYFEPEPTINDSKPRSKTIENSDLPLGELHTMNFNINDQLKMAFSSNKCAEESFGDSDASD